MSRYAVLSEDSEFGISDADSDDSDSLILGGHWEVASQNGDIGERNDGPMPFPQSFNGWPFHGSEGQHGLGVCSYGSDEECSNGDTGSGASSLQYFELIQDYDTGRSHGGSNHAPSINTSTREVPLYALALDLGISNNGSSQAATSSSFDGFDTEDEYADEATVYSEGSAPSSANPSPTITLASLNLALDVNPSTKSCNYYQDSYNVRDKPTIPITGSARAQAHTRGRHLWRCRGSLHPTEPAEAQQLRDEARTHGIEQRTAALKLKHEGPSLSSFDRRKLQIAIDESRRLMFKADEAASKIIFRANNPHYSANIHSPQSPKALVMLDVHNLYVREARDLVKAHIWNCRKAGRAETIICTGKGNNSEGGRSTLREAMFKFLPKAIGKVTATIYSENTGRIVVVFGDDVSYSKSEASN